MSKKRIMPDTASIANVGSGGKLHAPSAERNGAAILEALQGVLPESGKALEIASGTGQHVLGLAARFVNITWQPTEVEPERIASIEAWRREAGLQNILPPVLMDASEAGWSARHSGQNVIFFSNLLHLISDTEAEMVITEAAKALASAGVLAVYGPFMRGERFASEGDQRFHESLRAQDADIGYKAVGWVQMAQKTAGLSVLEPISMPANNLILVARK